MIPIDWNTIILAVIAALVAGLPPCIIAWRAKGALADVRQLSAGVLEKTALIEQKVTIAADILTMSGRKPRPIIQPDADELSRRADLAQAVDEIGVREPRQ